MKTLVLIEHMGVSNENGEPIGHEIKVLKEYYDLIREAFDVKVAVPVNVHKLFGKEQVQTILDHYVILKNKKNIFEKINDILKKFLNVHKALSKSDTDLYWFYCTDFVVILYLFFFRKRNKRVVFSTFRQYMGKGTLGGKLKNKIQDNVLKSLGSVIITNPNFKYPQVSTFYMPDYIYDKNKYDKYKKKAKKQKVVCLGTMNKFKLLEPVIEVFNHIGYPLEIAGKFYDKDWKNTLQKQCQNNVTIEDVYLSDEEYLERLSEAAFCIIPYDTELYKNRTSGVLLECVFLQTVPITFNSILQENSMNGLGIDDIFELQRETLQLYDIEEFQKWCHNKIKKEYEREVVQSRLLKELQSIKCE